MSEFQAFPLGVADRRFSDRNDREELGNLPATEQREIAVGVVEWVQKRGWVGRLGLRFRHVGECTKTGRRAGFRARTDA